VVGKPRTTTGDNSCHIYKGIFDFGELEIESAGVHETIVFKVIVSIKKSKRPIVREVKRLRK